MSAFSNGTEWDCWSSRWCHTCLRDGMGLAPEHPDAELYCPIVTRAIFGEETPNQWTEVEPRGLADRYTCSDYQPRDPERDARTSTSRDSARWQPQG